MNDIYILVENVTDADGSVDLPAFNLGYFNNIVNAQRMAELVSTPAQKFFVKTVNHASKTVNHASKTVNHASVKTVNHASGRNFNSSNLR